MNYRHAFHAGNFADLAKHAAVGLVLDRLLAEARPLRVVDTHAGAGVYDLTGDMARKSGESEAGVARLMADEAAPPAFDGLKAAVRRLNGGQALRSYPGSPRLIAERLRPGDSYLGVELHPEEAAFLRQALMAFGGRTQVELGDGYALAALAARTPGPLFVLVDPPFERGDDYQRAADLAKVVLQRNRGAVLAIWTPLKDLETFDAFIRRLETEVGQGMAVAELRLNALDNPLKMNGCAMIFFNFSVELLESLKPALEWIAVTSGGARAGARLWSTGT